MARAGIEPATPRFSAVQSVERGGGYGAGMGGDPVFASRKGTPLQHRNVTSRGFAPAAKLAGLEVSIHDTRHAFASRMISRGIDVVTLSGLLGHRNPRVTLEAYSHMYDRQKTDDVIREAMA